VGFTVCMVCALESVASYLEVVFVCAVRLYQKHNVDMIIIQELCYFKVVP